MRAVPSLAAAFATFSRVPVPQRLLDRADWTGGALAALPAVGAVQGLVSGAWLVAAHALGVPAPVVAAVLVALPFAVNGGIHMDGFSDVADARSSHAARERKLEIMKDPHIGAFGVMAIVLYLLMQFSLFACWGPSAGAALALVPMCALSRALGALSVVTLPHARPEGMAAALAGDDSRERATRRALIVQAVLAAVLLVVLAGARGACAAALALALFAAHRRRCLAEFGGITGDLAGWYIQVSELVMEAAIVLGGLF